ncbi:hypothetical protein [Ramlibacter sp.]|uniref:hypothetical protein n=1 Tax=Ramlibacter sp. TaxID=1917967 RepID=UPI003D0BCD32
MPEQTDAAGDREQQDRALILDLPGGLQASSRFVKRVSTSQAHSPRIRDVDSIAAYKRVDE